MNLSTADIIALANGSPYRASILRQFQPKPQDAPRGAPVKASRTRTMNGTERAFHDHLAALRASGAVLWFGFEAMRLHLAERTTYTPDFIVLLKGGAWEALDCKGSRKTPGGKETFYAEEDAMVKVKLAAELIPFRFAIVFKTSGGWQRKEFPGLVDRPENQTNNSAEAQKEAK